MTWSAFHQDPTLEPYLPGLLAGPPLHGWAFMKKIPPSFLVRLSHLLLVCICSAAICEAKIFGCPGLGAVATEYSDIQDRDTVDAYDFTEEDCIIYRNYISRQAIPRNGEMRDPRLVWHQNKTELLGHSECNNMGWLMAGRPTWCYCFYEVEGEHCENESDRASRPVKGAIVYLMYGEKRYFSSLIRAIGHLHLSFLSQFPQYPVIIFHSANFKEEMHPGGPSYLEMIRQSTTSRVIFHEVDLKYRESLREAFEKDPPHGGACGAPPGGLYNVNYLHMGRFFQYHIFRHPAVQDYDYLWRMDADLDVQIGVPCDVFDIMRRSRAVFGYYYYEDREDSRCGVWEGRKAAGMYALDRGFEPSHIDIMPERSAYLGGWVVMDMSFWTSKPLLEFSDYIDALGLAYTLRLGEQVFFVMATSVFAPASSLHQYAGLGPFWHRGKDIIWGKREVNGYNLIQSDVFCPEASEWECNDVFECTFVGGGDDAAQETASSYEANESNNVSWEDFSGSSEPESNEEL